MFSKEVIMSIHKVANDRASESVFPVYLETEIGGTSDQFLAGLKSSGFELSKAAQAIIPTLVWKPNQKGNVQFARVSVCDLFDTHDARPVDDQPWSRIKALGHCVCEPSDILAIVTASHDQSREEFFWIMLEHDGKPLVVSVRISPDGKKWLHMRWIHRGPWSPGTQLIFRLHK